MGRRRARQGYPFTQRAVIKRHRCQVSVYPLYGVFALCQIVNCSPPFSQRICCATAYELSTSAPATRLVAGLFMLSPVSYRRPCRSPASGWFPLIGCIQHEKHSRINTFPIRWCPDAPALAHFVSSSSIPRCGSFGADVPAKTLEKRLTACHSLLHCEGWCQ